MNEQPFEKKDIAFGYYPVLDGLRGLAVLMVMAAHLPGLPSVHEFLSKGVLGVDVFFVLSGFLITSVLIKEHGEHGKIALHNFYIRRFLRLMPAYWIMLFVVYIFAFLILSPVEAGLVHSDKALLSSLLYYSNLRRVDGQSLGVYSHTWSLSVEEQFYFIWAPLFYILISQLKPRALILIITILINVALAAILEISIHQGASKDYVFNATACRMFAIMIGSFLAMVFAWRILPPTFLTSRGFGRMTLAALVSLLVLGALFKEPITATYRILVPFAISVGIVIMWLISRSNSTIHNVLTFSPLAWIGRVSYGLYIWHPIAIVITFQAAWPVWLKIPVALTSALVITALSYYLIERPCLRLKRNFSSPQKLLSKQTLLVKSMAAVEAA